MSHVITSISPVSILGGAVDFSGELQMTMESMGFKDGDLHIHVAFYPSWNFGLDASAMKIDFRVEKKTYTQQEVGTEVVYEETALPDGMRAHLRIPKVVGDSIDPAANNCTLCLHITPRTPGVARCFMHQNPYVMMYLPCSFFERG